MIYGKFLGVPVQDLAREREAPIDQRSRLPVSERRTELPPEHAPLPAARSVPGRPPSHTDRIYFSRGGGGFVAFTYARVSEFRPDQTDDPTESHGDPRLPRTSRSSPGETPFGTVAAHRPHGFTARIGIFFGKTIPVPLRPRRGFLRSTQTGALHELSIDRIKTVLGPDSARDPTSNRSRRLPLSHDGPLKLKVSDSHEGARMAPGKSKNGQPLPISTRRVVQ